MSGYRGEPTFESGGVPLRRVRSAECVGHHICPRLAPYTPPTRPDALAPEADTTTEFNANANHVRAESQVTRDVIADWKIINWSHADFA
jgi:hypothetical protein